MAKEAKKGGVRKFRVKHNFTDKAGKLHREGEEITTTDQTTPEETTDIENNANVGNVEEVPDAGADTAAAS